MKNQKFAVWTCAAGVVAAAVHFFGMVPYAFPGESARLEALWKGLDVSAWNPYPLARAFAWLFGYSNATGAVAAAVAAMALFAAVGGFVRSCARRGSLVGGDAGTAGVIAGAVAAAAFTFAPGTLDAASRLEPSMVDAMWALLAFAAFRMHKYLPRAWQYVLVAAIGAMTGAGCADSCVFFALLPFFIASAWIAEKRAGGKGYTAALVFTAVFIAIVFAWSVGAVGDIDEYVKYQRDMFNSVSNLPGAVAIPLFTLAPFLAGVFSCVRAFKTERGTIDISYHLMLAVLAVIANVTALAPSAIAAPSLVPAVFSTIAASALAGYVAAYWWSATRLSRIGKSGGKQASDKTKEAVARYLGFCVFYAFAAVVVCSAAVTRFFQFDSSRGAFADEIAMRLVEAMEGREWIITDGTIDNHIALAAEKTGKTVRIVSLVRESDDKYIEKLADEVEDSGIGGAENASLVEVLRKYNGSGLDRQRLVPFIQKWFGCDAQVPSKAVVLGAPDMWLYAGVEPVAEQFFFGGDDAKACDWTGWEALDKIVHAPRKGWGSHGLYGVAGWRKYNYIDRMRLNLRRHFGLLAVDAGYALQEKGRKLQISGDEASAQKLFDRAFDLYELVLGSIDSDNVSALFNELELVGCGNAKARAKAKAMNAKLAKIKEDENRRYSLGNIGLLYGYICNPDIILRYGISLLRSSGRQGDGLNQIRRALQFVPVENRAAAELRLLAGYYAAGRDRDKARKMYSDAVERDASNREALAGLARLAMIDGDLDAADAYLSRAEAAGAGDGLRVQRATLFAMKGNLDAAKALLIKITDEDYSNIEAWALMASVNLRLADLLRGKDDKTSLASKKHLEIEIDTVIMPAIEKLSSGPNDFRLQAAKAMVLMSRGGEDNLRSARDAFIAASKERPEMPMASDMILDLDIRLNDTKDAERQALQTLAIDRTDPLSNYVMGSIALQNGKMDEAETYLRLASDCAKPVPLALNDLAETLRRKNNYEEAEKYARLAVDKAPKLYVAWETLGAVLLDAGKSFDEAEACVQKACDLSRDASGAYADVRMLMTLARIQIRNGKIIKAKSSLGVVRRRINELSEYERREFEELIKSAK